MLSSKKRFAFNVLTNWVATAVNMVVPFFLTPFVVHHLGPLQYGIWILAVSIVSYLALLDLGLRSAVIRFVSKANAQGQPEDAAAAVGAALWLRLLIAAGVCLLSAPLALAAPRMFKIPAGLGHAAELTVLLCAIGVAITLVTGVFGAVLTAINRFDLLSSVTVCQTALRAGGLLLILRRGPWTDGHGGVGVDDRSAGRDRDYSTCPALFPRPAGRACAGPSRHNSVPCGDTASPPSSS